MKPAQYLKTILIKTFIVLAVLIPVGFFTAFFLGGSDNCRFTVPGDDAGHVDFFVDDETVVRIENVTFLVEDNLALVHIKALKKGSTVLHGVIHRAEEDIILPEKEINVGAFNIIVEDGFIGSIDNVYIIHFELLGIMFLLLAYWIYSLIRQARQFIYSYRTMYYLGLIIFMGLTIVLWIISCIHNPLFYYEKLYVLYHGILNVFSNFTYFTFPILIIFSVFLIISNIILLSKEGRRITDALGILLGIFLVGLSFLSFNVYGILDRVMNVHSYAGYHISLFIQFALEYLLTYLECILVSAIICSIWVQNRIPPNDRDYVIILGCAMRKDGTPTPLLRSRIDRAIRFSKRQFDATGKEVIFVPSGGKGEKEVIAEAECMKNYLLECEIPKDRILTENKSTSTYENMKFSKELILSQNPDAKIAFSTSGYHVFRSGHIAGKAGMNAFGMGSKTKLYFYVNAWIREFIANLSYEKLKHIRNIIVGILVLWLMLLISYTFGII